MQVTEQAAEGLKRGFSVVVPAADIAVARDKRLAALSKDLRLPGFRPGKVPSSVVKQRFGAAVMGEVLDEQVQSAARSVIEERGLRPAMQPKIDNLKFEEGSDLEFTIELEQLPEIPLPDFSGIELEKPVTKVGDEEVTKAIEGIASRNRQMEDVTETRPAAQGDVVVTDFEGRLVDESAEGGLAEPFQGGTGTDMPVEIGGAGFIPGFAEGLEGINVGETRDVRVTFPADYGAAELAGKEAVFKLTAKKLQKPAAAQVDDDFAKKLGLADLAELKTRISESLQQEYDQISRLNVKRKLLDALSAQASFEVPQGMVDAEFAQIWQRVEADQKAGRLDDEDKGKDEDTLKSEYRAIAERRIRLGLLLSEIGRSNNIQVSNEELSNAMRQEAQRYPGQERQVIEFFQKNPQAIENLRAPLFEEKVVDFMLELAKVTEKEVPAGELSAEPETAAA
ncbi:trigger factor [Pseudoroseomonas wenyumeiae]|uniref:Trigger factor n=1 Tax=Teichococcus wenyumeiae TaxID=2478470 RepID=A0A3A9K2C3_9PROT|nr:trigger factor [Pseudoroseomonas wenyumeiae]RKK05479.1 trigger factor [Pseudoroseomonas wenyumeiae]RMI26399.1 trigger factor [Pseudoroseomonas wenyumeiae]